MSLRPRSDMEVPSFLLSEGDFLLSFLLPILFLNLSHAFPSFPNNEPIPAISIDFCILHGYILYDVWKRIAAMHIKNKSKLRLMKSKFRFN